MKRNKYFGFTTTRGLGYLFIVAGLAFSATNWFLQTQDARNRELGLIEIAVAFSALVCYVSAAVCLVFLVFARRKRSKEPT